MDRRALLVVLLAASGCTPSEPIDAGPDARARDTAEPTDTGGTDVGEPGDAPTATDTSTRAFAFDLDGNGIAETDLALRDSGGSMLLDVDTIEGHVEVPFAADARLAGAGVTLTGRTLRVMGQHVGTTRFEVAVLHLLDRGAHRSAALSVVDVDARSVIATASSPSALARFESYQLAAFSDVLSSPDGSAPFLAPGYGDGATIPWGYACVFRMGAVGGRCGAGFLEIDTTAPGNWFREVGGLTSDLDGDGTGDLTLIYHTRLRSYSGASGALLADTEYDVALADEPGSPRWFHSGRNYGTVSFVRGADARDRLVIVGGAPVGSFTDYNCNVSRFVAVLDHPTGVPSARALAWSDYFGFGSSIFRAYDPMFAADPSADLARMGDFMNGCIHRLGDSRVVVDGVPSVMFNYFLAEGPPADTCLDEQYALYLPPAWSPASVAAWNTCFSSITSQRGTWGMQVRRLSDGMSVTGSLNTYVWGATDRLLPGGELLYVVESMPSGARWDTTDAPESALHVWALASGLWAPRGDLPIVGRPAITLDYAEGDVGVGSFTGLAELVLEDTDGDDLAELVLASGERVEWDETSAGFAVR